MAEAQFETRTRTVEAAGVALWLTEDEAEALYAALGRIAIGSTLRGVREALVKPTESAAETSADTFEYSGITYEFGPLYRDSEGDYVEFAPTLGDDDTPMGRVRYGGPDGSAGGWAWTLAEVVRDYGPLTKVTA